MAISVHSAPISANAPPRLRSPKKMSDQIVLRASCPQYSASAWRVSDSSGNASLGPAAPSAASAAVRADSADLWLPCRQMSQDATPINRYSTVHTGPNSQLGGFQDGFFSLRYQVLTDETVATAPKPPANCGRRTATARLIQSLRFN